MPNQQEASHSELGITRRVQLLRSHAVAFSPAGSSQPGRPLLLHRLTLTCDSVIPREYASLALSGPAKYLVCSKVFSRAKIWCPVKVGRVCFFLWMLSLRGSGAGRSKDRCG